MATVGGITCRVLKKFELPLTFLILFELPARIERIPWHKGRNRGGQIVDTRILSALA
jgi:hypothetical protein